MRPIGGTSVAGMSSKIGKFQILNFFKDNLTKNEHVTYSQQRNKEDKNSGEKIHQGRKSLTMRRSKKRTKRGLE